MQDDSTVGNPTPFIQLSNTLSRALTWESGLEGKLLTIVDGVFADPEQRKAVKSLIKEAVRNHYADSSGVIDMYLNHFTEVFEGEEIRYTKFDSPNGYYDSRESKNIDFSKTFVK